MLRLQDLILGFKSLGLERGDVLLVHSSYKSFGGVLGGPQVVIDALMSILTEEGTLIMPTFNFDFCNGKPFDVRNTPSKMGILTEIVRKNTKSKRTIHPIHSFAILGKLVDVLGNIKYESNYGGESIFAKLKELNGKIMIIGLSYNNSVTFFHHVEEMETCDYRYFKEFKGLITDHDNITKEGKAIFYVRDLQRGVETDVERMGKILELEGIAKVTTIGNSTVRLMKANEVYRRTVEEMKRDPYILCKINK